jgi:hypothetical protein
MSRRNRLSEPLVRRLPRSVRATAHQSPEAENQPAVSRPNQAREKDLLYPDKRDVRWVTKKTAIASRDPFFAKLGASRILSVLGPEWFAEVKAVQTSGKVVWCNFDLARKLGFDVPASNRMTPAFHDQLIEALSYRALRRGEHVAGRKTLTMFADRYGGEGVGSALGACRAAFLPYGNIYIKGIGFTPLFTKADPDDFWHSHGTLTMRESIIETVFGEEDNHLLTNGSARVLAIIDVNEDLTDPKGKKLPCVLSARVGTQLRPGHLLARGVSAAGRLKAFAGITRETGQLITRTDEKTGRELPDLKATMLRVISDHARTAAEQFRWRILHGAISPSNMEMSGAMLDLATQSTQPRTAPIYTLGPYDSVFGREHVDRATSLGSVYRALARKMTAPQRRLFNARSIRFPEEMEKAYAAHLRVELLSAIGLKPDMVRRIAAEHPALALDFAELFIKMAGLRNPGSVYIGGSEVEAVSVLDVFNLLKTYPQTYFENPSAAHTKNIRAGLKPVFGGNRFHVASKRKKVTGLIKEFDKLYRRVMEVCQSYAKDYYDSEASMRESIISRAAFENEPIKWLFRKRVNKEIPETIAAYKSNGNVDFLQKEIAQRITRSLRNPEALLVQGASRRLADGGFEIEMLTIDGINHSVRAWNDRSQKRRLHVSVPVERDGDDYLTPLANLPRLTKGQIQSLRYRYTIDGRASVGEVDTRLEKDGRGGLVIHCRDIPVGLLTGQLEGAFYIRGRGDRCLGDESTCIGGYTFAIPDGQELRRLIKGLLV